MLVMKGAGTMLIKEVAMKLGINEALFLQQLHYFLQQRGVEKEGRIWFFHNKNSKNADVSGYAVLLRYRSKKAIKGKNRCE